MQYDPYYFMKNLAKPLCIGGLACVLAACANQAEESKPIAAQTIQPPPPVVSKIAKPSLRMLAHTLRAQNLTGSYAQRAEVMVQVPDIAKRLQLPETFVRNALGNADHLPRVVRLMTPSSAKTGKKRRRNWRAYRKRFIDPVRIRAGVEFWRANEAALYRAEREFGVPAHFIVGIIGVETIYGRYTGNIRVLDALATLSFDFPQAHPRAAARNKFFRQELEAYLLLCAQNGDDPQIIEGSYAGAMGLPQFMPSSWQKYAVDYDGDGRIDLFNSPIDAIGSVANYFKAFGWEPNLPPLYNVRFDTNRLQLQTLLEPDIITSFTPQQMYDYGAVVEGLPSSGYVGKNGKLALVELENGSNPSSYYAGTQNFYVITRYNHSSYYAKSVIDLGEAVLHAMR